VDEGQEGQQREQFAGVLVTDARRQVVEPAPLRGVTVGMYLREEDPVDVARQGGLQVRVRADHELDRLDLRRRGQDVFA
jgi:hypothetical protein